MPVLVITPLKAECDLLARALTDLGLNHRVEAAGRLQVRHFEDRGLLLARGGHGKAHFATRTSHLLTVLDVELIICAGSAGALNPEVRVGDLVLATHTIEHDYRMAIGSSDRRIMWRVIFPNALPPLIVSTTLIIGVAILFEAGLAFLGLGAAGDVTWGLMIGNNRGNLLTAWWTVTFPGLAIFVTVLSISLIGDGLQDAFNPKLRNR